jgi:peptide deformylase
MQIAVTLVTARIFFAPHRPFREGRPAEALAEGLLATVLQHEVDHLNRVVFIDHISKLKRDRVIKKFQKAAKHAAGGSHVL